MVNSRMVQYCYGLSKSIGFFALTIQLVCSVSATAKETFTVSGYIADFSDLEGVWIGVAEEGKEEATGSFAYSEEFEIQISSSSATLLVVAKNQVPASIKLNHDSISKPIEIRLSQGFTIDGSLVSKSGKPLHEAIISIVPDNVFGLLIPREAWPKWTIASNGQFQIDGLFDGTYTVEATAKNHVPLVIGDVPLSNQKGSKLNLELLEGTFVTGEVINDDGNPAPGIEVCAQWADRKGLVVIQNDEIQIELSDRIGIVRNTKVRTALDGTFRIGPVEATTQMYVWVNLEDEHTIKKVYVTAPRHNLVLQRQSIVLRGTVIDALTNDPVEEFTLNAYYGNAATAEKHRIQSPTGDFETIVHADTMAVSIEGSNFVPWLNGLGSTKNGHHELGDILLERPRSVRGLIRNAESGTPIAGARVRRSEHDYDGPYEQMAFQNNIKWGLVSITDELGMYALDVIPRQSVYLEIGTNDFGWLTVKLPADVSEFDIDLQVNGIIAGTLMLGDEPATRGTLQLVNATRSRVYEVAGDGRFKWEHLSPGSYSLQATSEDGLIESQNIELGVGETIEDIQLRVDPGYRIFGTITGLMGFEQATKLRLVVRNKADQTLLTRSFPNGSYSLRGLPRESTISAQTSTGRLMVREVNFLDQEEIEQNFNFEGNSSLAGRVTSESRPVKGIRLRAVPTDPSMPTVFATTSNKGSFWIYGLAEGAHAVYTRTGYSFPVHISGDTVQDFTLSPVSLSGTAREHETHLPLMEGGVRLELTNTVKEEEDVVLYSRIGDNGVFTFKWLIPGSYKLEVSHSEFETFSRDVQVDGVHSIELKLKRAPDTQSVEP